MKRFLILLSCICIYSTANAQFNSQDYAVQLTATVQVSPAKITLQWLRLADTTSYTIYKKKKTDLTWSGVIATLTTNDSTYADTSVIVDSAYEYQVIANHHSWWYLNTWAAAGYIYAAIKAPAIHTKGALVLVVDSTYSDSCAAGIHKLMKDISGDGWQVIRHDVARTVPDTAIKAMIKADYTATPNVKAVMLLGHIAVPYSGDLNPDGHPDHKGAWPTDLYYAELTGAWTDASVNDAASPYAWIQNIPGDGKWDQTTVPGLTQLQVSRIDVYNMPAFSQTDVQMMASYLAKDHAYKMDSLTVRHKGIISDNFGVFTVVDSSTGTPIAYHEAFASTGWRSFPPLLGYDSIASTSALIPNLDTAAFQWAYGCGGGSFSSSGGIGTTADFAANNMNGIFVILFGSYFGDWNVQNNFLRAPLCSNTPALTSCWSGRPYWFFHHMALGENIGFSGWHSQNNTGALYGPANIYGIQDWVHINLLGDLTLRTQYIKPITNLVITHTPLHGATLNWTASADATVAGYYVYKSRTEFGSYQKISGLLTATTFHDTVGADGLNYYMVRPTKLQATPSGNYNNLGIGITDSATVTFSHVAVESVAAAKLDCSLYPNPASNFINIALTVDAPVTATLCIMNVAGERLAITTKQLQTGNNICSLQVNDLPAGVYSVQVSAGERTTVKKWVKL